MTRFDPRVELRLGGRWVDITSDTRDDVEITRGRSDEASNVDPGKCSLTINNRAGRYSPRNPMSPHYGVLGRNTPIRVWIGIPTVGTADDFQVERTDHEAPSVTSRTGSGLLVCGWISNFDPGDYTIPGSMTADAETDLEGSTLATAHEELTTSGDTGTRTATFSEAGQHATASVAVPGEAGAPVIEEFWDGGVYAEDVEFLTGTDTQEGWLLLAIQAWQYDFDDSMSRTTPGGTPGSWTLLADSQVASNAVARIRVWARYVSTAGPQHVVLRAAQFRNNHARLYLLSGVPFASPRFAGEVSSWPQRWDLSGNDVWVPIEAAGILRRLGQGQAPLRSAIYREITSPDRQAPVVYWPCEDGERSGSIASALDEGEPMLIAGSPDLRAFSGFAASDNLPLMKEGSLSGPVPDYTDTGETQTRWLLHIPSDSAPADGTVLMTLHTTGSAQRWDLTYDSNFDTRWIVTSNFGTEIYNFGTDWQASFLDTPLRFGLEATQNGSDIDITTFMFPVGATESRFFEDTITGHTFGRVTRIEMARNQDAGDVAMGHLSLHNTITSIFDLGEALNAFRDEPAGRRVERLCREQEIAFTPPADADLDDSSPMGAQGVNALLALLQEAAIVDGGILHETREDVGLSYRPRRSLYNQQEQA